MTIAMTANRTGAGSLLVTVSIDMFMRSPDPPGSSLLTPQRPGVTAGGVYPRAFVQEGASTSPPPPPATTSQTSGKFPDLCKLLGS
jgi:hypothetical protein